MMNWHPDTIAGAVMFGPFLIGTLIWVVGGSLFWLLWGND
jgi:hypothetical protein